MAPKNVTESLLLEIQGKLDTIITSLAQQDKRISAIEDQIKSSLNISKDVETLKAENQHTKAKLKELQKENLTLRLHKLRKQISIRGVPRKQNESLDMVVKNICLQLSSTTSSGDIQDVFRKKDTDRGPGEIIVKFSNVNKRNQILTLARKSRLTTASLNIEGSTSNIYINAPLLPETKKVYYQTKQLLPIKNWKKTWLYGSEVFILMEEGETWIADDSDYNHLHIKDYTLILSKTKFNQNGGVGLYIHDNYTFNDITPHLPLLECDIQACEITHKSTSFSAIVIGIYRNPSRPPDAFVDQLPVFLSDPKLKTNVIILGDFNIDVSTASPLCNQLLLATSTIGFHQLIEDDTRTTATSSSRIDLIFTNIIPTDGFDSFVLDLGITDHSAIGSLFCLPLSKPQFNTPHISYLLTTDKNKANQLLQLVNWNDLLSIENPATCIIELQSKLQTILRETTTTKKCTNHYHRKKLPWMNSTILQLIRKKDRIAYKYRRHKENILLYVKFKNLCNIVKKAIRASRIRYFKLNFRSAYGNPKRQWEIINSVKKYHTLQLNQEPIMIRSPTGLLSSNPLESAIALNSHYTTFLNDVPSNLESAVKFMPLSDKSAFFVPSTTDEVISIIKLLKLTNTVGLDNIPLWLIRNNAHLLAPVISHSFNNILTTGVFPNSLKQTKVIPIFKKGNRELPENYRPITILNHIAKIIDKLLYNRLESYIESSSIGISDSQHGFRKHRSTNSLLRNLTSNILDSLHDKEQFALVTIDYSKAFDSVPHNILLYKLERLGLRGVLLNLFTNYLTDRKQSVVYFGSTSPPLTVCSGVSQGTCLGPLLYSIYTSDAGSSINQCHLFNYADDTGLGRRIKLLPQDIIPLQDDIDQLVSWSTNNGLIINNSKTELIIFGSHLLDNYAAIQKTSITISNELILPSTQIKYLGIILDDKLKWKPQIEAVATNIRKLIPFAHTLHSYFPNSAWRLFYNSIVESKILYNLDIWSATSSSNLHWLQQTQNLVVKALQGHPYHASATFSLQKFKVPNCYALSVFRYYQTYLKAHFTDKTLVQEPPILLSDLHKKSTRAVTSHLYHVPKFNNNYGRFHPSTRLPSILNTIRPLLPTDAPFWNTDVDGNSLTGVKQICLNTSMNSFSHLF